MLMTEPLFALVGRWREEAEQVRIRYADNRLARVFEIVANELESAIEDTQCQVLTLEQAAELSGYSVEHLGHLVRTGQIPNAGRKGAPRIRLEDCPKKRSSLTNSTPILHLEGAQARQIAGAIVAKGLEANDG